MTDSDSFSSKSIIISMVLTVISIVLAMRTIIKESTQQYFDPSSNSLVPNFHPITILFVCYAVLLFIFVYYLLERHKKNFAIDIVFSIIIGLATFFVYLSEFIYRSNLFFVPFISIILVLVLLQIPSQKIKAFSFNFWYIPVILLLLVLVFYIGVLVTDPSTFIESLMFIAFTSIFFSIAISCLMNAKRKSTDEISKANTIINT